MSVQEQIDRISTEVTTQETLLDQALSLIAGKAAGGGSGGGSLETCELTIKQQWGGNDDPAHLYLYIMLYEITDGELVPFYTRLTSAEDCEAEHSVTLTVYKNVPITFSTFTSGTSGLTKISASTTNGTLNDAKASESSNHTLWQFTPTGDTATFTFFSE